MKYPRSIALLLICVGIQPVFGGDLELTRTDDQIASLYVVNLFWSILKPRYPSPKASSALSAEWLYHPVYTPTGHEITGDFPADHAHQHALFFAWTKAGFDGKKVDFWNQAKDLGRIEFREVVDLKRGNEQVSFSVKHAFTVGMDDERADGSMKSDCHRHLTPDDHFLFDIESVQKCASSKPLNLAQYRYGECRFGATMSG